VDGRLVPCGLRYSERRFVGPRVSTDQIDDVAISSIARLNGANNDRDEVTKASIRPGLTHRQ